MRELRFQRPARLTAYDYDVTLNGRFIGCVGSSAARRWRLANEMGEQHPARTRTRSAAAVRLRDWYVARHAGSRAWYGKEKGEK